ILGFFPDVPGYAYREDFTIPFLLVQARNRHNGSLSGVDYVRHGDFGWVLGQRITPLRPPLALEQPGLLNLVENLFKVSLRHFLAFANVFNLGWPTAPMIGDVKHRPQA